MDRTTIAQMIAMFVLLALVPPLVSSRSVSFALGRGALLQQIEINRTLGPLSPADRAGTMRFRGVVGAPAMTKIFEVVDRIHAESPPGEVVDVFARGIGRNVVWMLAFDLYPHRVLADFNKSGQARRVDAPEGVEWSVSLGPDDPDDDQTRPPSKDVFDGGLILERHP